VKIEGKSRQTGRMKVPGSKPRSVGNSDLDIMEPLVAVDGFKGVGTLGLSMFIA
jgi:hypothetical protein